MPLPVPRFLMRMLPILGEYEPQAEAKPAEADQVVTPDSSWPQITLLCATRPEGWPA